MSTVLIDSFNSLGGKGEGDSFLQLGYVNAFLLEIGVFAFGTGGVKLGSTSPVGVPPTHLRTFFVYWANSWHRRQVNMI